MEAAETGDGEVLLATREADRPAVIREVVEGRLRQMEAARRLCLGVRQVKRLARRYRERGPAGLASGRRGGLRSLRSLRPSTGTAETPTSHATSSSADSRTPGSAFQAAAGRVLRPLPKGDISTLERRGHL